MNALVGTNRDDMLDFGKRQILARRKRLLDQGHAGLGAGFETAFETGFRPSLVGVGDEGCIGRAGAHRASRAASPSPASLIFNSGRTRAKAAACAISSGVPTEIVKAVATGTSGATPASTWAGTPLCLAAKSQSAQSSALRAAPGGRRVCKRTRSALASIAERTEPIWARTESTVSP